MRSEALCGGGAVTTIAADLQSGTMASDSQWSDGAEKGTTRKVYRINGALIGFAGDWDLIAKALIWFRKGKEGPCPRGEISALILNGKLTTWEPENGFMDQGRQFAIGTGGAAARAAMMAGVDVRKAVSIACKIDAQSGGPVRTYRVK
jgi:ATP-dependent protease HslVU (ClpYQ) peptidase subunit